MSELRRVIRRLSRWLTISIDDLVCLVSDAQIGSEVAIIRLDAIGDFVLWLDSAGKFREQYREQRITLIANAAWADLAKLLPYWDEVWAVDTKRLCLRHFPYRWRLLRNVASRGFAAAIQPTYSRVILHGDSIVRATQAPRRIGSIGDHSNISKTEKSRADKWYTDLIAATEGPLSELERNAEFVTRLFHRDIPAGLPELTTFPHTRVRSRVDGNYFIVFPGAAWSGRRWSVQHFAAVARRLQMEHGWRPVACGSEADGALCDEVVRLTGGHAVNLAGSTTLPEFCLLVRSARILIANETSAVHIANAVGTPSICVLGGGHFGRFLPYPDTLPGRKPVVVYQPMECFGCNWRCVKLHTAGNPVPCIASITVEQVIDAVDSEISRLPVEA